MSRKRWIGGLALMVVLGASAAAIASGGGPKIDQVQATITYTFVELEQRSCGPEGEFTEQRVRGLGTAEGDARLTGDVEVRLKLLNEGATGESFQKGKLIIRDPETGRKKVVARFVDAGVAEIFQGVLVGTVRRGSKDLIANWRTTFHANGAITAEIGGEAADGRLPAIVTRGGCKGPFESSELEIPPPDEEATAARRAPSQRVGWRYR